MRLPRLIFPGRRTAFIAIAAAAIVFVVGGPAQAKVSGSNGRIAFARFDPTIDDDHTYTMNPDGSNVQPLFPAFGSISPHWSPDGTQVAVVSGFGTFNPNTVIINPDTSDYRVLPSQGFPVQTFCSLWSPEATHFACAGGSEDPTLNGVYTIRSSDGGGLTRITNAEGANDIPIDYSPDGTQIVFGRVGPEDRCTKRSALYVVNVDGSGLRRITPWGFCDDNGSWSPDGSEIAFEHSGSIFVVHPDGSGLAQIPLATNTRASAGDAGWSPDGTKIVFLLFTPTGPPSGGPKQSFQEGLATANADGSNVQQVTTSLTKDHQPDWGSHALITP
jgi:Tol biopolymer transport system component